MFFSPRFFVLQGGRKKSPSSSWREEEKKGLLESPDFFSPQASEREKETLKKLGRGRVVVVAPQVERPLLKNQSTSSR